MKKSNASGLVNNWSKSVLDRHPTENSPNLRIKEQTKRTIAATAETTTLLITRPSSLPPLDFVTSGFKVYAASPLFSQSVRMPETGGIRFEEQL